MVTIGKYSIRTKLHLQTKVRKHTNTMTINTMFKSSLSQVYLIILGCLNPTMKISYL